LTALPSATRDQTKQKADAGSDANGLPGVGMHVFFGALNGSLTLIAQRAFLGHQRFLRPREVLIDLTAQFLGLAASRFLGVLEQALGIGDQGAKISSISAFCAAWRLRRWADLSISGVLLPVFASGIGVLSLVLKVDSVDICCSSLSHGGQKVPLPQVSSMAMAQGSAWHGGGMIE